MQEKRNKLLFISLLVLTALTTGVYFYITAGQKAPVDKNIFKISRDNSVDRVLLESPLGKVELAYHGTKWRVNDRYDADRNLVKVLFATLQEAEPRRPVAAAVKDSLAEAMEKNGVRVSLFSGQRRIKSFYAGGNPAKTTAYFLEPETRECYLVAIPGYRVYVSGIFELNESGWRDKYVFAFNWRNFKDLKAEFPDTPSENFSVSMGQAFFGVEGIATDTTKLNLFMDHLFQLTVNRYIPSGKFYDSLVQNRPVMILTVHDIANRTYSLKLFHREGEEIPGIVHENEAVLLDRTRIAPILRPKSFFRKQ